MWISGYGYSFLRHCFTAGCIKEVMWRVLNTGNVCSSGNIQKWRNGEQSDNAYLILVHLVNLIDWEWPAYYTVPVTNTSLPRPAHQLGQRDDRYQNILRSEDQTQIKVGPCITYKWFIELKKDVLVHSTIDNKCSTSYNPDHLLQPQTTTLPQITLNFTP